MRHNHYYRHRCGVFDCPVESCETTIVGNYSDLLGHVETHAESAVLVDGEGQNLITRVAQARNDARSAAVRERLAKAERAESDRLGHTGCPIHGAMP